MTGWLRDHRPGPGRSRRVAADAPARTTPTAATTRRPLTASERRRRIGSWLIPLLVFLAAFVPRLQTVGSASSDEPAWLRRSVHYVNAYTTFGSRERHLDLGGRRHDAGHHHRRGRRRGAPRLVGQPRPRPGRRQVRLRRVAPRAVPRPDAHGAGERAPDRRPLVGAAPLDQPSGRDRRRGDPRDRALPARPRRPPDHRLVRDALRRARRVRDRGGAGHPACPAQPHRRRNLAIVAGHRARRRGREQAVVPLGAAVRRRLDRPRRDAAAAARAARDRGRPARHRRERDRRAGDRVAGVVPGPDGSDRGDADLGRPGRDRAPAVLLRQGHHRPRRLVLPGGHGVPVDAVALPARARVAAGVRPAVGRGRTRC